MSFLIQTLFTPPIICLLDILRGSFHFVCCIDIHHHQCISFLPFYSFSSPWSFPISPSITHRSRHTSLSLYSHGILKRACPHCGGFCGWVTRPALLFPDTCQSLICHLLVEMEMSRSDTTCQRWRWRLSSLRRLLNQLHSSWLVLWLGYGNYLLPAFRWTVFVMQWCHTT